MSNADRTGDNACTATRKLAGPALRPAQPDSPARYLLLAIAILALAGAVALIIRRRAHRAPPTSRLR